MFDLNDLLLENDNVDESCDSEHTEITSPDDGSGVKGGKEKVTDEGFMYYECEIDESNIIDGDPFEFITEAMYQNVINANNIAIAVLADEYKYLKENGTELHSVSEAAEEQDAKKKNAIAKWFASVGDKLSKFLDTILSKMMTLQAKFLLLFKKARTAIEAGFNKKDLEAPKYAVVEVEMWAEKAIEEAKKTGKSAEFSLRNGTITKETKGPADFGKEVMVIQRYGEHIKKVKKLKKDAMKALKDAQKNCEKNALGVSYAKCGNAVVAVTKEAISVMMYRITAAAKNITAALKKEKPKKEETKADEKKAEEKATGEAASFLESLEMI